VRSTGRREPEVARRADGVSRAGGCIRESGHDDGAGELQAVRTQAYAGAIHGLRCD